MNLDIKRDRNRLIRIEAKIEDALKEMFDVDKIYEEYAEYIEGVSKNRHNQ